MGPTDGDRSGDMELPDVADWENGVEKLTPPSGLGDEIKEMLSTAVPVVLMSLMYLLHQTVSYVFIGGLGDKYLAAAGLALMFVNITGISVGFGMASALDTLVSQEAGNNPSSPTIAHLLQRSIMLELLICVPIGALWYFGGDLLGLYIDDTEQVDLARGYIRRYMLALPILLLGEALKRYQIAQGVPHAAFLSTTFSAAMNPLYHWFIIHYLDFGWEGAPYALAASNYTNILSLVVWQLLFGKSIIWVPWSSAAFRKWKEFLALGIPGSLGLMAEWGAFEVLMLLTTPLGKTSVAAQSVCLNIIGLLAMIPLGLGVATAVRIGSFLGANLPDAAWYSTKVSLMLVYCIVAIQLPLMLFLGRYLAMAYISDDDVLNVIQDAIPLLALFNMCDTMQCWGSGVFRGTGRQTYAFYVNVLGYWIVGLPYGSLLARTAGLGVQGFWLGEFCGSLILGAIYVGSIIQTDFGALARKVDNRIAGHAQRNRGISDVEPLLK